MHALAKYKEAKQKYGEAAALIDLIGKPQNTTSKDVGKLHGIAVSAKVHYQATDGAKNYHESSALDAALCEVVKKHWPDLHQEALALLKSRVEETKVAAAEEYKAEFEAT